MLDEFIGQEIVIDLRSPYVCLGTLIKVDEHFLELRNADLHDLRDTETTRENYVAASLRTGIKRNRKRVLLMRSDMLAVSRLKTRSRTEGPLPVDGSRAAQDPGGGPLPYSGRRLRAD